MCASTIQPMSRYASTRSCASSLPGGERCHGPLRDQAALLFGKGGVQVQHERISIAAQLSDDERYALCPQPGQERNVAAQAVQFGNDHAALGGFGFSQRAGELRPAIKPFGALLASVLTLGTWGRPYSRQRRVSGNLGLRSTTRGA
jgi:hypothetical protein